MSKTSTALVAVAAVAASLMLAQPAWAAGEVWVSGTGNDSNDCQTPTTPCRQIGTAIGKTFAAGTVHVLPGNYDRVLISGAILILADQSGASISNSCSIGNGNGCFGIVVQAGASDVVRIRGITVNQLNADGGDINFVSGAALEIENCTLVNASTVGLQIASNLASSDGSPVSVTVSNSVISANPSGNVLIAPTNNVAVDALFEHVKTSKGLFGVKADDTASGKIRVDMRDSIANDNKNNGYLAVGTGANPVHFMIEHSTASSNGVYGAVATGAQAFMIATYATLIGNGTGLAQLSGSTVAATGTNTINFNATNTAGTITAITLH